MNIFYEQKSFDFSFENSGTHRGRDIYCPPHFHNHIEIVYMEKGSAKISIDLNEYILEQDDLLVVFPNQVHGYTRSMNEGNDDHSFVLMLVDPHYIPSFPEKHKGKLPSLPIIKSISKNATLSALVKLICNVQRANSAPNDTVVKG